MKQLYIVAGNAFTVSAPDDLQAWTKLSRRYRPFAAPTAESPVLAIDISVRGLSECGGERIYEPAFGGIGYISARTSRLADGSLVMEFTHIDDGRPRLTMKMPPELNRADISISPDAGSDGIYFLAHAMMISFMLATLGNGTLLIHASTVISDGRAYLFQGKSGTGKSTHAALWAENVAGAELLNDDHPVVRVSDTGVPTAYGSPWSGKTHCYRNVSAPIGAFVRIVRAGGNALRQLPPLKAYASLTASVYFLPFLSESLRDIRHRTVERLVKTVPCCEMHCRPDADAALTCRRELTELLNNKN